MRIAAENTVIQKCRCIAVISIGDRNAQAHIQLALVDIEHIFHDADIVSGCMALSRHILRRIRSPHNKVLPYKLLNLCKRRVSNDI
ncbi:hypothetical protein D3C77_415610 [compost metagenome]